MKIPAFVQQPDFFTLDYLERSGQVIGGNDLMIAAIALTYDLTLVTHNGEEFQRVPGLRVEDWTD